MLTAGAGTWTNSPTSFRYHWLRCDSNGNNCDGINHDQSLRLTSADSGHRIRLTVSATNQYGSSDATSAPTAVVAGAGATNSVPVQQVSLPQRLVVSAVKFTPSHLTSRNAFIGRFRVSDTRGNVISGALVYSLGLPYGWVRPAAEVVTGADGWAQITFVPTVRMPLHRAAVVFFVRARKPGDSALAGVSTRRLVQVRVG